jgi:hypothetical protein
MAFDPIKALTNYADDECSVQFWVADHSAIVIARAILAERNKWVELTARTECDRQDAGHQKIAAVG